jgi:galactose oxidase
MDQRVVQLTHTGSGATYTITMAPTNNHLPPGMYMLFAIDSQGVPSEGKFIRIKKV